jgi:hypothetical protein
MKICRDSALVDGHRKHADLAPRLAAALKQMKAEGLIERYRVDALRESAGR